MKKLPSNVVWVDFSEKGKQLRDLKNDRRTRQKAERKAITKEEKYAELLKRYRN